MGPDIDPLNLVCCHNFPGIVLIGPVNAAA